MMEMATFRFYGPLNDLLPLPERQTPIEYTFYGKPGIKDAIETLGVPHPLVFMILVHGKRVDFSYHLSHGDSVSVYPPFRNLPVDRELGVIPPYQGEKRFITGDHLGRLARYLRQMGFDTIYHQGKGRELIKIALQDHRIILSKDKSLLKCKEVLYAYLVRENNPKEQLLEVLHYYQLFQGIKPLGRCLLCNHLLLEVHKEKILKLLEPLTRKHYHIFYQCPHCHKIYWQGSHYREMMDFMQLIKGENRTSN